MTLFKTPLRILLLVSMTLLAACAQSPVVREYPQTADAGIELQKLNEDFATAYTQQTNVLSHRSFEQAEEHWKSAKDLASDKRNPRDVLNAVARSRAWLEQASGFGAVARAHLEDVVTARQQALNAGASTQFSRDFGEVDARLAEAAEGAERKDIERMERARAGLLAQYSDLEVKAIQHDALGAAQALVEEARREGAETLAAQTLADTERKIRTAEAFINNNRHEKDAIGIRTGEVMASAEHLLTITRVSKANQRSTSEEVALRLEQERRRAEQSQARFEEKTDELTIERGHAEVLNEERRRLEGEQRLDRLFEEARSEFAESEAEVYRQGDKLLIRLKGLDFPKAQASLREENFPLLSKVGSAIRKFGKVAISVEGHTDSQGDDAVNDKLSVNRAQAVAEYLASAQVAERADIRSEGYGDRRPIATNKTPSGRAQNRRVDLVISPNGTEQAQN